jgi:hypothetical protein
MNELSRILSDVDPGDQQVGVCQSRSHPPHRQRVDTGVTRN